MKNKKRLPQSRYLVFIKNGYDGYGGLTDYVFGFDNPKSGLSKLKVHLNEYSTLNCNLAYEVLDTETREYTIFATDYELEKYLTSAMESIKEELKVKQMKCKKH